MLNNEEEEDDTSFYIQKNKSTMLKTVSGLSTYRSCAEERIRINREPPAGNANERIF
jgi:hypothetical protein